jgi:hypothetical protein
LRLRSSRTTSPVRSSYRDGRVTELVIEQRAPLCVADGCVVPEILFQQDHEIERRELAADIRRLLTLPERHAAVAVRPP